VQRLVLGSGEAATDVAEATRDSPGETRVRSADAGHVETLREGGVNATLAAPTDPDAYPDHADLVVVADSDGETAVAAATTARRAFPDAALVAVPPAAASAAVCEQLAATADRVADCWTAVADRIREVTQTDRGRRLRRLLATLRSVSGPLAVVTHDNPDPDAIAAALALVTLAERVGVEAEACYAGRIAHQENRALVNLLELDLREVAEIDVAAEYGAVALVDHAVPGVNDSLTPSVEPVVVIDHHPPGDGVDAAFADVRPEIGATATMLTEYVETMGVDIDTNVATALLYGIRVDTQDFVRGATGADFDATATLLQWADPSLLDRVESPSVAGSVFGVLAAAIRNRVVVDDTATSCVGELPDRDALPQAAEKLLSLSGICVAVVYGYTDGTVYVSARARGTDVDLGETLRDALGSVGSAGGHADMAGAQLDLGILQQPDDPDQLQTVLEEVVSDRVFETLSQNSRPQPFGDNWSPHTADGR